MQLLIKNVSDPDNPKNDNSDKKPLFPDGPSFKSVGERFPEWDFVGDENVRRNICYQLQYMDFLVRLYNEYQMYLTMEALLCKNILISVNSVVEAALYTIILETREAGNLSQDGWRSDYAGLLGQAYHDYQLIDRDLWNFFHGLRKERNNLHLTALSEREYEMYSIDQANEALKNLEKLRKSLQT